MDFFFPNVFKDCFKKDIDDDKSVEGITARIDRELTNEQERLKKTFKILILGGPASGKSTIFKQMRILHMNGFSGMDTVHFRYVVLRNLYDCLAQIITIAEEMNVTFDAKHKKYVTLFQEFLILDYESMLIIQPEIREAISSLCNSPVIEQILEQRNNLAIRDSALFFISDADRILSPDYQPSVQDVLRTRIPTIGIHEIEFEYKNKIMKMTDLGGQRTERRKWIHCFDNVSAILFIIDISSYNMKPDENELGPKGGREPANSLKNSFNIFGEIANLEIFSARTAFIVFLNKMDIFKEKIDTIPLSHYFRSYKGDNSFDHTVDFLTHRVKALYRSDAPIEDRLYTHVTTATDTECIRVVFEDCTEAVLRANLATAGYI